MYMHSPLFLGVWKISDCSEAIALKRWAIDLYMPGHRSAERALVRQNPDRLFRV